MSETRVLLLLAVLGSVGCASGPSPVPLSAAALCASHRFERAPTTR